ncbi:MULTISPECIES: branched-chain amino acid ABC transporter permease [Desulfovibrio]|uniref:Inner-membrane translocator n=2 Tax=root TaxID=1 RepID=A0A212JLU2_9BACT|nr:MULTISPECIES: branched-chain amino acid ABC transporter permease [Desulfovibrio]MBD8895324.1 branched-chain amino acid ABC transporter permease [Desulfovibrio desulfuricans]MBT9747771.1 branched-chain amino acid ABC transporter permease [Desulfovibrio desulfuricans]MCB6543353.1 branched-chain amino acid ABC transporter permease [Desulfovibrio desulfuricans]MCB6554441.1 branched-chain amino acid ABC transporter permease [Desulfovibrio desulfuricans]MCB6566292.1 branched-chain amino acid ABC 
MLPLFVQTVLAILGVLCFGYAIKRVVKQKKIDCLLFLIGGLVLVFAEYFSWIDGYWLSVIKFMGLNVIFATSLNLVNGYMGEFSCGHAGFMCVGAYVGGLISIILFTKNKMLGAPLLPPELAPLLFPLVLAAAGGVAALFGLLVALPSFKTRDDYLAIITIAANYIIISLIINIDFVGGPRGLTGMRGVVRAMESVADIPWMMIWMLLGVMITTMMLYRLVNSTLGKGIPAVCQNEVAAEIMSVNTKKVKLVAFMVSAGIAGVAGALYAHMFSSIYANSFGIMKSTEAMVMVYLGGMGSLSGSVLAAVMFTLLIELLRFALPAMSDLAHMLPFVPNSFNISQEWKWVIIPLILILLMQFRPEGLLGNRELTDVFPKLKRLVSFGKRD